MASLENKNIGPALERDFKNIWHPCTQMKDHESVSPLLVDRAQGVYLYDREGRRYMDVISSWWVNLFGHNHPRLNEALKNQLESMAHVMFAGITHQPAIDLAESLVRLTPENLTRVFFSDNGSTSIEIALKMSLQFWVQTGKSEKKRFVYLRHGYHGETLGALSVCGEEIFRDKFDHVLIDNTMVDGPDCFRCPYDLKPDSCNAECFEPMAAELKKNHSQISAVIVEPLVQGAGGMRMYPPIYLEKLQSACREVNVHTIYDEVAVAFGRTGSMFVCQEHKLNPTFLCLSKGITSGYLPLAATLADESIYNAFYDEFETFKWFIHSHSYSANPLACAVANESLAMLEEPGFFEGLHQKINELHGAGEELNSLSCVGEFRQTGMIAAIELVADPNTKEPYPVAERIGYKIFQEGLKRELFIRPLGNVVYFMPPLIISKEEIQKMMVSTLECIHAVTGKESHV